MTKSVSLRRLIDKGETGGNMTGGNMTGGNMTGGNMTGSISGYKEDAECSKSPACIT
jgi:hypothetical protein